MGIGASRTPFFLSEVEIKANVSTKTFLVVGGTKGVGAGTAKELALNGARVVVAGRSSPDELLQTPNISFIRADLSTVKCCIELADKIGNQTFDTVIFTIGMFSTKQLVRTSEGVPEPLSVNYLSRFVLVQEIIKRGLLVGRKRLYIFGYPGTGAEPLPITDLMLEHTPYENWPMQKTTVALNEALGYELVRRYPDITVVGVNPGFVTTDIMHPILGKTLVTVIGALFGISPETYAKSYFIHVVASEKIAVETRHTIVDQKGFEMPQQGWAKDEANSAEAWKQSQILVDRILESNKSTLNQ